MLNKKTNQKHISAKAGRLSQRFLAGTAGLMTAAVLLAGCGTGTGQTSGSASASGSTSAAGSSSSQAESTDAAVSGDSSAGSQPDGEFKVGVIQFAQHGSLDNCYEGLVAGLEAGGYKDGENITLDLQNANADPGVANQIAGNFVSRGYDLIIGIATPAAQAAFNAANQEDIPVLFTAVTDPVLAGLANEDGTPKPGVTGTSDVLPIENQLTMIRAFLPEAETLGILYSLNEANSVSAIEKYKELAPDFGFTIEAEGVAEASFIPAAADSVLAKADALTNLTDNLVVENMPVVLNKAMEAGIPYFGSEEEQVRSGLVAAAGLDYLQLGQQTGEMGAQILDGTAPEEIPIGMIEEASFFHNSAVMAELGVTLPDEFAGSQDLASK